MSETRLKIGITQGDTNGIGWEVILKTFADQRMAELCTPVIYGSPIAAEYYRSTIEELENILKNAEVVVEDEVDLDKINVGCTVKVFDITYDEDMEFKIVGSTEANSLEGKISNESPVGQALMGKKAGDTVTVETQAGDIQYKILEISRSK